MAAPLTGIPPFGALSVTCPVCMSSPGRACTDRRGYLLDRGSHAARRERWLENER